MPSRIIWTWAFSHAAGASIPAVTLSHSTTTVPSKRLGSMGRYTTIRVLYGSGRRWFDVPFAVLGQRGCAGVGGGRPGQEELGLLVADLGRGEERGTQERDPTARKDRTLDGRATVPAARAAPASLRAWFRTRRRRTGRGTPPPLPGSGPSSAGGSSSRYTLTPPRCVLADPDIEDLTCQPLAHWADRRWWGRRFCGGRPWKTGRVLPDDRPPSQCSRSRTRWLSDDGGRSAPLRGHPSTGSRDVDRPTGLHGGIVLKVD